MKCRNCGNDIMPGNRFCKACGTPTQERNWVKVKPGSPAQKKSGNDNNGETIKIIIIGVVVGLAILAIVFGLIYFLRSDGKDSEIDNADVTVESADGSGVGNNKGRIDENQTPDYDSDDVGDYSEYYYYSEEELYQNHVPVFFPDSSSRYLTRDDLYGMSDDQIQKAINDIYARNGRIFKTDVFRNYYEGQSWYIPISNEDDEIASRMNRCEKKNIDLMNEYRQ